MRKSKTQHTSPLSEKTARKPTERRDSLPRGQQREGTAYHRANREKGQLTTGPTERKDSLPRGQ